MKKIVSSARLALLPLALSAALPAWSQSAASLSPVLVTATRFAEPAQPLPLGVSVITAAEIEASGAATVNEALMRLLGVVGRQDFFGGGEYNLDLRGFGASADSNQVVVVDGLRLTEADLGGTRLAGIPIESVERIEVLRGSGAVLYGEGATGGVIVITTRSGGARGNSASVYAGAGSYGLRDLRANATVARGGFSLDVAGQKRDSDNHRDNFRSRTDAASLSGQWANDWLRLGVRLARDELDARLPGALSAEQYRVNPRQTTTPNDSAGIRNERASVSGQARVGGWELAGEAGTRDKTLASLNSGFPFDYDVTARNYSLRARNQSSVGGLGNALVLGVDGNRWSRNVLGDFGSVASQRSTAVYLKDDVTLAGGTRISAGLRTERIVKESSNAAAGVADRVNAWELGASQSLAGGFTVYGRYGRSFRLANVDEFSFARPDAVLRPQLSRDLELGARWAAADSKVEARLYRSRLQDEIGFDPAAPGPFGPGANVNFDPTRRQGLELDAAHALSRTLGLRLNAGWRESTFSAGPYAGRDVPLAPRRTLALRADWAPAPGHRLTGGVNWVSTQHPDFDNACTMPGYSTADLRYAYSWQRLELSLGVSNLFDRRYYAQAYGCAAGATTAIYPEAGRAVTAAVRVNF